MGGNKYLRRNDTRSSVLRRNRSEKKFLRRKYRAKIGMMRDFGRRIEASVKSPQ
jgi:hypothetical protein